MKKVLRKIICLFRKKEKIAIIKQTNSNQLLNEKVALITGGSGGIGFAIAEKYINCGAKVIISGRNEEKLKKCCNDLGKQCAYIVFDQVNIDSINDKVLEASKIFGKIDILVNNAGTHISRENLNFFNIIPNEYDEIMDLNLKSTFFVSQAVSNYMKEKKISGNILMISSSRAAEPTWSPYGLSKLGITGLTKGIAKELIKYNITVNGIAPGPTATSMQEYIKGDSIYTNQTPLARYTLPEEVAEYAVLLVSDLGKTIIGDTLYMSGGRGTIEYR